MSEEGMEEEAPVGCRADTRGGDRRRGGRWTPRGARRETGRGDHVRPVEGP